MSAAKPGALLRVVLDTNVYFAAFNSTRGVPFKVWRRAVRGECILLISPVIIRELVEIVEPRFTLEVVEPHP